MKYGILAAGTLLAATATAASAGGYVPPVVDTTVVAPVVTVAAPVVGNWEGGYAGLSLGYGFGGKDDVDFFGVGDYGDLKPTGALGEARIGYRWQRDRWVFGPELSYMGGNIEDSIDVYAFDDNDDVAAYEIESSVRGVAALKMKAGYEVMPNTLVYGTLGYARGEFKYNFLDTDTKYRVNGAVFGIGVERAMNERVSLTAELERNQFKKTDIVIGDFVGDGGGFVTEARPSFNTVKVGVNFRF